MFTDTRIADLNGPLLYWGPSRFSLRTAATPTTRANVISEQEFGDLNGPLAYWGPVTTPSHEPVLAGSR